MIPMTVSRQHHLAGFKIGLVTAATEQGTVCKAVVSRLCTLTNVCQAGQSVN
jgi:hypothetical protein